MKSVAVSQSLSHRASLSLPLRVLFEYFNVKDVSDTPDINQLNQLAEGFTSHAERRVPEFVEAQQFEHDPRYYETIVAELGETTVTQSSGGAILKYHAPIYYGVDYQTESGLVSLSC